MQAGMFKGANGALPISLGWGGAYESFTITGGPYNCYPGRDKAFGVCVRAENTDHVHKDAWLPIVDFKVPTNPETVLKVLKQALGAALEGRPVYVGCMGGWGRTGLFLALLAKAAGIENPIEYVRSHYTPHAVETAAQERYVEEFDVSSIKVWLFWQAWSERARKAVFWWL